jgi:hypothetical protein
MSPTEPASGAAPSPVPQSEGWLARRGPLLLCLMASLPLLVPVLNPAVQLYYRDTLRLYYPVKKFIADQLALGRLPFWDPWTESGTSLLGQMSPGLLHPLTLLYAALPFDLAFKLNHLVALPLAALGTYLLARRLPVDRPAAAVAGVIYGGCGYLLSTTGSNLPYALGAATVPWAVAGLLWLCERPSAGRLLAASAALALCCYAGEPQSALFAALLGGPLALLLPPAGEPLRVPDRLGASLRRIGLTAAWGLVALCLSAPVLVPVALRMSSTTRWSGLSEAERSEFALHPAQLLGLAIPHAFDEVRGADGAPVVFYEYFAGVFASFAESPCLGPPAMLLAVLAALVDRRGRYLALAGLVFALAACGRSLGVYDLLLRAVPGLGLFRYSAKLLGPCSLLLALAAARGAERGLSQERKPTLLLARLAFAAAGALVLAWVLLDRYRLAVEQWLIPLGREHLPAAATGLVDLLLPALVTSALLSVGLGLIAVHRLLSPRGPRLSVLLAAVCCAAAVPVYGAELLQTANADLVRTPPPLAAEMLKRAGPSEGRWRILFDTRDPRSFRIDEVDARFRAAATLFRLLEPQFDALFLESTHSYFSLPDRTYFAAMEGHTGNFVRLYGVRFIGALEERRSPKNWKGSGFTKTSDGIYLREVEPGPRAFLVDHLFEPPAGKVPVDVFVQDAFSPRDFAVVSAADARQGRPIRPDGKPKGTATFARNGPDGALLEVEAPGPRFLVIGEHFDAGWKATIDGVSSPVVAADGLALGLWVPAGKHQVVLRFRPAGFGAAAGVAGLALLGLLAWMGMGMGRPRVTAPAP